VPTIDPTTSLPTLVPTPPPLPPVPTQTLGDILTPLQAQTQCLAQDPLLVGAALQACIDNLLNP